MEKLKIIAKIRDSRLRKKILSEIADQCLYKALNEIAVNTVSSRVPLNRHTKINLRKYKTHLNALANKTTDRRLQKKLVVQSGGFLPILIPAIASVLGTVLTQVKRKKL